MQTRRTGEGNGRVGLATALVLAAALLLPALATPAAAQTIYRTYGPVTKQCEPVPVCSVTITLHFIWSESEMHCKTVGGTFGCDVYHECQGGVGGINVLYGWTCNAVGGGSGGFLAGGVPVGGSGHVWVPAGPTNCQDLTFLIAASSVGGTNRASLSHTWRVCVDANGPYIG